METNLGQQTPKLPKLNVTNVSSAVFGKEGSALGKESNIGKLARIVRTTRIKVNTIEKILPEHQELIGSNVEKIKLNTEKIISNVKKTTKNTKKITSIKNTLKNQKSKIGEKLSGSNTDNFNNTLIETNRILVEIQKQLAYDFAMRIAERDEENKKLKEEQSKKRFKKEESILEKSRKKIGGALKKTAEKTVAPLKNIFEKIKDFLVIVSLGIATNTIFDFLSKEENREKLSEWFDLVAKNWKWIGAGVLGLLALKPIFGILGTIGGIIALFRTAVDVFRLARRIVFGKKPPAPGTPKPGTPTKPNVRPGSFQPRSDAAGNQVSPGKNYRMQLDRIAGAGKPVNLGPKYTGLRGFLGKAGTALGRAGNFMKGPLALITGGLSARDRLESGQSPTKSIAGATAETIGGWKGAVAAANLTLGVSGPLMAAPEPLTSIGGAIIYLGAGIAGGFGGAFLGGKISDTAVDALEQRAMGGPIMAGKPYLVGEGGPELIVPKISGTVINNMKTEKIYQMISSGKKGRMKMITLPPQIIEGPKPKVQMPLGAATKEPKISSSNFMDGYRSITSEIYGITV